MTNTTLTYRLPKRFPADHWNRDLGQNDVIKRETANHYYVTMDADGYSDMLSDAEFYSDHLQFEDPKAMFGLAQSAIACAKVLIAKGAPERVEPMAPLADLIEAVTAPVEEVVEEAPKAKRQRKAKDALLTPGTHDLFMAYASDAGNWSGTPLVGGNVGGSKSDTGRLTDMKKKGLIETSTDEGNVWVHFTEAGVAYAAQHGVDLAWINGDFKAHYAA